MKTEKTYSFLLFILLAACTNCYAQTDIGSTINSKWDRKLADSIIPQPFYVLQHLPEIKQKKTYTNQLIAYGAAAFSYSPKEALIWYKAALSLSLFHRDQKLEIYNGMAAAYSELGNYKLSFAYLQKALNYLPDTKDSAEVRARIYSNIGAIFLNIGNLDKSAFYLDKAIKIYGRDKADTWVAIMLYNKAVVLGLRGDVQEETATYRDAYKVVEKITDEKRADNALLNLKSVLLNNMSGYYIKKHDADSAIFLLKQSIVDFSKITSIHQSCILISCGNALGIKKMFKSAIAYTKMGLDKAIESGHKEITVQGYKTLANICTDEKDYKSALKYEQQYIDLKDSIFEKSKKDINNTNDLENKYAIAKKDKEIAQKQLQLNVQKGRLYARNFWTTLLALGLISTILILLAIRRNYLQKQKLFKEQLENAEKSRRIMQIEATMKGEEKERTRIAKELHDGVVSEVLAMKLNLSTIKHEHPVLQSSHNFQNILMQAEEVAQKLRQTAHNLMPVDTNRKSLHDSISGFLKRISDQNIHFRFQYYGEIPALTEEVKKIIFLMILELIQNIIKHSRATEALIQLDCFEGVLGITVEDNGVGLDSKIANGDGIGLTNLKENASLLQATIDIKSSEYKGSTFYIEIPLEENNTSIKVFET